MFSRCSPTLRHVLRNSYRWSYDQQHFIARAFVNLPGQPTSVMVAAEELAALHPDLSWVVAALVDRRAQQQAVQTVHSAEIVATLTRWVDPFPAKIITGSEGFIHRILDVCALDHDKTPSMVDLRVAGFTDETLVAPDGRIMPVVDRISYFRVFVPAAELDKRYPGWLARYRVCQDLGYGGGEMTNQVFTAALPLVEPLALPQGLADG